MIVSWLLVFDRTGSYCGSDFLDLLVVICFKRRDDHKRLEPQSSKDDIRDVAEKRVPTVALLKPLRTSGEEGAGICSRAMGTFERIGKRAEGIYCDCVGGRLIRGVLHPALFCEMLFSRFRVRFAC